MPLNPDDYADARMDDDGCTCHIIGADEPCPACDYGGDPCD